MELLSQLSATCVCGTCCYLIVVLEKNVLLPKKKKNRFPAYYIRAYRVYAADGKFFSMPAAAAAVGQLQNDVVLVGHRLA